MTLHQGRLPDVRKGGLLSRVRALFGGDQRKETAFIRGMIAFLSGRPKWSEKNFHAYAKEGYGNNVYVYAGISLIAKSCAGIPLVLYRKRGSQKIEVEDHPILDLLRRPNPWQGYGAFTIAETSFYLIAGNAYTEKVGPIDGKNVGRAVELYTHRPDKMAPKIGTPAKRIEAFAYRSAEGDIELPPEKILHLRAFNPIDEWIGMGPVEVGARSVDQNNESRAWNVGLLQNAARPSGAFVTTNALTPVQYEQLHQQLLDMKGSRGAGRSLILEGGVSWEEMSHTPVEMAWVEGSRMSAIEIAVALNVPPELLGIPGEKKFANFEQARKSLYTETVFPLLDFRLSEYQRFVVDPWDDRLVLDYDRDKVEAVRDDRKLLFDMAVGGWNSGLLTRNESRRMIGEEDEPDGDVHKSSLAEVLNPERRATLAPPPADQPPVAPEPPPPAPPTPAKSKALSSRFALKEARAAEWKRVDTNKAKWVKTVAGIASRRFETERKAVRKAVRDASSPKAAKEAAAQVVDGARETWTKTLASIYQTVGRPFAQGVLREIKAQALALAPHVGPVSAKRIYGYLAKADDTQDLWSDLVSRYLDNVGGDKVTQITDTTQKQIIAALDEGIANGEGTDALADRIDGLYLDQIIPNRSEVIARTEVGGAAETASYFAADSTGLDLEKTWAAVPDDRTRDDHAAADGQTVAMDDAFVVGGEKMLYPLDASMGADGSEIIQCRCTALYSVRGGES